MNKPRATTAGENKHTSTEAHMSKVEVKVMKGDRWEVWGGLLYLVRGDRNLVIRNQNDMKSPFFTVYNKSTTTAPKVVDTAFASVIIESLGGTVVEEREEEKAAAKLQHVYVDGTGEYRTYDQPRQGTLPDNWLYLGTTTIHIAGVTA